MKKLLALVMALVMALSCAGALAEAAQETPEAVELSVAPMVNREWMLNFATSEEETAQMNALLDLADKLAVYLTVNTDGTNEQLSVYLNEQYIASVDFILNGESVQMASDLFPNYVITVPMAAVEGMAQGMMEAEMGGVQLTEEEIMALAAQVEVLAEQLAAVLPAYGEDLVQVFNNVTARGTVDADGAVLMEVTTHDAADLLSAWAVRATTDEVMKPIVQAVADALYQQGAFEEPMTADMALAAMQYYAAQLKATEATTISDISFWSTDDGAVSLVVEVMEAIVFAFDVYAEEGIQYMSLQVITDQNGVDDYESIYNAVASGENVVDVVLGLNIATLADGSDDAFETYLYMISGGEEVDVSLYNDSDEDEDGWYNYTSLGLDMGTGANLLGLEMATYFTDALETPSVAGKTVIDATVAGDNETTLLLNDMMNYGLQTVIANAQAAMPEQVAALLQLLMEAQQPEAPAAVQ